MPAPQPVYFSPVSGLQLHQPYQSYRPVPVRYQPSHGYHPAANHHDGGGLLGGGNGLLGGGGGGLDGILTAVLPLVLGQVLGDGLGDVAGGALGASAGLGYDDPTAASFAGLDPGYHDYYGTADVSHGYGGEFAPESGDDGLMAAVSSLFGGGLLG